MKNAIFLFLAPIALFACKTGVNSKIIEESKTQIVQTEKEFEKMAAEKGVAEAFAYYVADSGVVQTGDSLYKGKLKVKEHYLNWKLTDVSLKWKPDFVDVAASCDLGYTYGRYTFSFTDSTGAKKESQGYFHTVWKKQADGSWKFVWD